ncbi:hypothetical protein OIU85_002837 [Salix viminalis]|uniref:Uncharacterized protein n=1 Tax=Salix viminalis TaxID=40686 RepID=A0A9Q0ZZM5_SALVM|nr:hypothetical protein OIU85_002837 [Salix viminalis]
MSTPSSLAFTVRRCEPELVAPARATPHEFKPLSDIDRQLYLQFQSPHYNFYAHNPSMRGTDPVMITRLECGGFILGFRFNHPMSDAIGLVQLLSAIGEISRGAQAPSILPVWQRQFLCARNPPRVTCTHNEYGHHHELVRKPSELNVPEFRGCADGAAHRCFIIGPEELSNIRKWVPPHLLPCSKFEIITASLWKCYAIASQANPNEEMRICMLVNARSKFNPPVPEGYYGNVLALPAAITNARKLCLNSLGFALELIRHAKNKITEEYIRSLADFIEITKGLPKGLQSYVVSDLTSVGFDQVDYGWGKPVYTGPSKAMPDDINNSGTYYLPYRNKKGERGTMVLISLRAPVMERFALLFEELTKHHPESSPAEQRMTLPIRHKL